MLFLIAYDYSFHKRVVYRGIVSPAVVLVSPVVNHLVLRVHILTLKSGPFLYHSPTLFLSQCTIFLPGQWLPCFYFLVMVVKSDVVVLTSSG